MKIGLIAMSAKPYHVGHDNAVRLAARECDEVHVFVSLSDRARPGEVPILGSDMAKIWRELIEPTLPTNVAVTYGGAPVGNVWKELGEANEGGWQDEFVIYGDRDDLSTNFPEALLNKYAGNLNRAGQIKLRATERSFSGTQMRALLASGDKQGFTNHLPAEIDRDAVWDTLSATAKRAPKVKATAKSRTKKAEGALRSYVRLLLSR